VAAVAKWICPAPLHLFATFAYPAVAREKPADPYAAKNLKIQSVSPIATLFMTILCLSGPPRGNSDAQQLQLFRDCLRQDCFMCEYPPVIALGEIHAPADVILHRLESITISFVWFYTATGSRHEKRERQNRKQKLTCRCVHFVTR